MRRPEPDAPVVRFAREWIRRLPINQMPWVQREALLIGLATQLADCLAAPRWDPRPARAVGMALARAGFTQPDVAATTLILFAEYAHELSGSDPGAAGRLLPHLQAAVVGGHTAVAHDLALDGHETLLRAAVTARRQAQVALLQASLYDQVTGLPNRTLYTDRLTQLIRERPDARAGVCIVDLDGFRAVNDSTGLQAGDTVLRQVAIRIQTYVGDVGGFVARLGDDEFAVLVENTTSLEDVIKVADRVLSLLAEPIQAGTRRLRLRASAGIVERPLAGSDAGELIRAAEVALGWAQAAGGNTWRPFDPARNDTQLARQELSADIPAGIDRGEFQPVYQPIVALDTGNMIGAEALVRWQHPQQGQLRPGHFLDLVTATGYMVPLTVRLLNRACHDAAAWPAASALAPYLSFNIAPEHLTQPEIIAQIADALDRSGLAPSRLQIEITETEQISTNTDSIAILRELAAIGVRLVLDDFGTGNANYLALAELPLHGIKIDASFTRSLTAGDPRAAKIVHGIVRIGLDLGLNVTAEGIESIDQLTQLHQLRCHNGQGYYFSRPVDAADLPARLRDRA
ncbi:putative bifunctional diguanylate cyclase/phosphodiesterase [Dactylosporangium sp. CA-092794]|uniref:putative bifunctional diguanylate cyclase/phosphodiesterase n=1 Tax=Dactylosporangium sp. CA-092794 TaxID=3239929 RepID=UPI003D8A3681